MADADIVADTLLTFVGELEIGSPALRFAMPDVLFDREKDAQGALKTYLEVLLFFNRPAWQGVGGGQVDQGLLQITIVGPPRRGIIPFLETASALKGSFPIGSRPGGVAKISQAPWHSSPIYEAAETRVPVTIPWTA